MRIIALVVLICLAGCGYTFPGHSGTLPGGVERLYVPLVVNKTSEPQLENKMSNRLSEVLPRNSKIILVDSPEEADGILKATVLSYSKGAISYDRNDDISEYRATIVMTAVLQQAGTEEVLWERTLRWSSEYIADTNKNIQSDLEKQAIDEVTLRLAEETLFQLTDDF
jgi:outer membrane lipopolysaccharide assembly protein LptE/RlpB